MRRTTEFVCPKCGGHTYGSSRPPGGPLRHHCHSEGRRSNCDFTWPPEDRWRYFVIVYQAETEEEHQSLVKGDLVPSAPQPTAILKAGFWQCPHGTGWVPGDLSEDEIVSTLDHNCPCKGRHALPFQA